MRIERAEVPWSDLLFDSKTRSLLPLYKDKNAIGIVLEKEDNAKL